MKNTEQRIAANYIMEDPREPKRLSSKVNADEWVEKFFNKDKLDIFTTLDVGCGSGDICYAIAKKYPNSEVIGIDFSKDKIDFAQNSFEKKSNPSFVQGDAFSMEFESNSFDYVLSRFVFEYLKEPNLLLNEMKRVCKPGGIIMIQDLDGQILWHSPKDDSLSNRLQKVIDHLGKETGFDPFVGRKLYGYFHHAQLDKISVNIEPYHLYPGKIDDKNYRLWELKLDIILPKVEKILGGKSEAMSLKMDFLNYLKNEKTLTYSNLFTVSGKKSML